MKNNDIKKGIQEYFKSINPNLNGSLNNIVDITN